MMETARPNAATRAQIAAADPKGSVWLAANAGSGKTRVLTNRVAWLLLEGAAPERILCLTFTRAAAAEMQNRLSETLGEWAMLPDDSLRQELTKLGVEHGRIDSERLQRARTLFARAIETPGGLKIQTIHAFCASLLRRFPMEAGITPAFREMDDIAQRRLLNDVLDSMAEDPSDAPLVEELAGKLSASTPDAFLAGLAGRRDQLGRPAGEAALRTALGVAGENREQLREWAIDGDALDVIERMRDAAAQDSTVTAAKMVASLSEAILADANRRYDLIRAALLTGKGEPRKKPLTKTALQAFGGEDAMGDIEVLIEAILATDDALRGLDALDRARLLHDFAPRFLDRLASEKSARGWLDYDDLVLRARDLLSVRETAQWVLYKLDGGIDHVLVDEAQDTSQVQWDVIEALTGEFGAGDSARDTHRTLFVVGDRKQSIFSFQGADPVAFDAMRERLGHQLEGGAALADHALLHSFRSAPSILRLVDRVFDEASGAGDPTEHIAFNAEMPGRVDLWDHIPEPDAPEARDWTDPVDQPASDAAHVVLAGRIAATIDEAIKAGTPITHKGERRAMQARDVLILFRSRDRLFNATIAACKRAGLEMAGADRLRLDQELAVRDLLALCRFATTPEDDLSLAAVLRSPLGGLSESDLFTLAHGRKLPLWRQLRDHGGFDPVADMVEDVMGQADFLRPYELLQRILIRHDGRRKLLGRLGNPAAEAIDGLLQQALSFEALEVPSLTAFLGWVDEAEIEIKREATGGAIRVMSIHGSKGLEAPVVIVPQCGPWKPNDPSALLAPDGETLVWRPSKPDCNEALLSAYEAAQHREAQERDRLLYVALTRAESWLICASAGTEEKDEGTSWAGRIRTALVAEGAEQNADVLRLEEGDWSSMPIVEEPQTFEPELPSWANIPVPEQPATERLLSPSDLGGAKALPGDDHGGDRDAALRHGSRVHALLEYLPNVAEADQANIADHLIARHAPLAPNESSTRAVTEALATLAAHPAIFSAGTLAEVPFVLPASGGNPGLQGTIDRVVVTEDTVLIVDFKTNQAVPSRAEDTPDGLLRQLGAYREAAAAIWPGKTIETAILWTSSSQLMTVPHDLVTAAWLRATAH